MAANWLPSGTAHVHGILPKNHPRALGRSPHHTSSDDGKDQSAIQSSAENSYKSTAPYLQDDPMDLSTSTSVLRLRKQAGPTHPNPHYTGLLRPP